MNVWKLNAMCTYFVLIFLFALVHSEQQDTKRLLVTDPDAVLNRLRILEDRVAQLGTPTRTFLKIRYYLFGEVCLSGAESLGLRPLTCIKPG